MAKHRKPQVNDIIHVQIDPPFPVDIHILVREVTPTVFKGRNALDVWDPIEYQFPHNLSGKVENA